MAGVYRSRGSVHVRALALAMVVAVAAATGLGGATASTARAEATPLQATRVVPAALGVADVLPDNGAVGQSLEVFDLSQCAPASDAVQWVAVVSFVEANATLAYIDLPVSAGGDWGGFLTIPTGAVPGAASVVAMCFDPTGTSQTKVNYAPAAVTVNLSGLSVSPASNAPGSVVTVSSTTPCPAPSGAGDWTVLVNFGQSSNLSIATKNFVVAGNGNWGGSFTVPTNVSFASAGFSATCFDATHKSADQVIYDNILFTVTQDTTPPVLHLPANRTVNATTKKGATVKFTATTTDTQDPAPTIVCQPKSGATFAIGNRGVSCIAHDLAGNSASGGFTITVRGAASQIRVLITTVRADKLSTSLTTSLVNDLGKAWTALAAGSKTRACTDMTAFSTLVKARTGHGITSAKASALRSASSRIRTVIGC